MGKKWQNSEIIKLKELCEVSKNWTDILPYFPERTLESLKKTSYKNNIKLCWNWNEEELSFLLENYNKLSNNELAIFLNRTSFAINRKLNILKLKKSKETHYKDIYKENLKNLLDENPISYYYMGYLLADGNFSNGLSLEVSINDIEHMENFLKYIECDSKIYKRRNCCAISISDRKNMNSIKDKFDIFNNKTIYPPSNKIYDKFEFDKLTDETRKNYADITNDIFTFNQKRFRLKKIFDMIYSSNLIQMLKLKLFLDGDGHIRKSPSLQITIQLHHSWFSFLELILSKINTIKKINTKVRLDSRGYATLTICGIDIFNKLNEFIDDNKLPILKRKWKKWTTE